MTPRWQKMLKEYTEAIVIAFILAMIIRAFFVQAFKIPSGSMLETLQIGDHLLVSKLIYGVKVPFTDIEVVEFSQPERGDVIVFEYPVNPSQDFIKRVIGLPGDTVEIRNKDVYVNGKKLDEPYVQHTDSRILESLRDNMAPRTVPENEYFVMGDNRDESHDSRFWGFVDRHKIEGKAWVIYWSWRGVSNIRWNRIGDIVR
ncbi:signal peptidase I [Oceanidesulfovibrio marinus]|uniref:Signal peptidase I n=1 Tax=Oceanidesulfovibrio marinus TaxID=370038 RepID=A0A6P1ZBY3_9BACT|nr:signal peptidase I [Oceanidesulfovibrio marinus]QJT09775.1 signal peptidase I [Oceanidesulfovibrio marinus]TVM31587.1 signal peptidase I [Oceanidesulfovibrio marinus]